MEIEKLYEIESMLFEVLYISARTVHFNHFIYIIILLTNDDVHIHE